MDVSRTVLSAGLLSEVLMSQIARYCLLAATGFLATVALTWTARLATDGFSTLRAAVSLGSSPTSTPMAPNQMSAAAGGPISQLPNARNVDDVRPILPARFSAVV